METPRDAVASGRSTFLRDLGSALRVWRRHPWLPLVSLLFAVLGGLPWLLAPPADATAPSNGDGLLSQPFFIVAFALTPVAILAMGWLGTERLVYMAAWRGVRLTPMQVLGATGYYVGRFVRLGLIVAPAYGLIIWVLGLTSGFGTWPVTVGAVLLALVVDVALTFVTPTLAFSTDSAGTALRDGLRLLRRRWPDDAWYALAPPLVLAALAMTQGGTALGVALSAVYGVVALLAKGAIAAQYLRLTSHDVDGMPVWFRRDATARQRVPRIAEPTR